MKYLIILAFSLFMANTAPTTVHEFTMQDINGDEVPLSDYSGKVLLIVNTASECGYTPQYEGLQELYKTYNEDGLVVLGFPANNFGGQEPGSDEEILEFCTTNFDVSFPMFSKVSVKGEDQHPLFNYLTTTENPDFTGEINWNFEKFLIDKDGKLVHRFRSKTKPMSDELTEAVQEQLKK